MRSRSVSIFLICLVAIATLWSVSVQRLYSQALYGSVAGTVTGQTGAVVPGAAITIVNDNTGFTRNTTPGSADDYRLTDIPGGIYTLSVTAQGFKPLKQTGINVQAGSVNQQNVQLEVGAVTQQVTVSGAAGQPLYAAFGTTADVYAFQGYLGSHYNSLQVSLNRHVTNGLFLQGSYTYSNVIGYMDDEGWENGLNFNCPASPLMPQGCQALNRHTLSFDHTHVLKMAFIYDLPFGAGQKFVNTNKAARAILGGWQLNGIITGVSGDPLYPSQASDFLNTPYTSQVPGFSGTLNMLKQTGPGEQWFNTTAFTPVQTATIGNGGRGLSWLRGPGLAQLDLSLFRTIKLTERFDLKVKAETLNFSNTPHWSDPNMSCSIVNGVCGGGFGQITSSFEQRIFQLGAEVDF